MKVCTFLGDPFRIYDEVTQRIEEALEEILAAHGEMELYFHGWFGEFPRACAAAALRVKGRHPDRIVTLTLAVSAQWQEEPAACCVFDRIIRIPVLENSPDMGRHRLLQAILRRCDCLISYVYLELRGEEAQILSSVRRRRRLTVLDVTDPEPLPPEHPLWHAPNTILTPHVSGLLSQPENFEKAAGICVENLRRFLAGQPLLNQVDRSTGYVD